MERELESTELERLNEVSRSVWAETVTSCALLILACVSAIAVSFVSLVTDWYGTALLCATSGLIRYLPRRRFFSWRVLGGLRRDRTRKSVYVCKSEDITLEVLCHSHLIWSRNSSPPEQPVVAHATTTARLPEHAGMAANFVHPAGEDGQVFVHQRVLTPAELAELDSYAPRPSVALFILAGVGLLGGAATFGLALRGRLQSLLAPFAFAVIGIWAARAGLQALRARKRIAADLEAGFVLIVRTKNGDALSPASEFLPFSTILWSEAGVPATWRKYLLPKSPPN